METKADEGGSGAYGPWLGHRRTAGETKAEEGGSGAYGPWLGYRRTAGETKAEEGAGAYGPWLAYMMNIKRVDADKLAQRAGVTRERIDQLIRGEVPPHEARQEIALIGEILLSGNPKEQMERVLKALEIHVDLRNWAASCDGGCCTWNVVTEIAYDAASIVK
jgi:hypothetical protein